MTSPAAPARALPGLTLAELTHALGSRQRGLEVLKWLYAGPYRAALPGILPTVSNKAWRPCDAAHALVTPPIVARDLAAAGTTK